MELGRRLYVMQRELDKPFPSVAMVSPPEPDRTLLQGAAKDFLLDLAGRFLRNLNGQFYRLICDSSDPDHVQVQTLMGQGVDKLGFAIAGALVASGAILPGIAAVLGAIIAKRIVESGSAALCESWKVRFQSHGV